MAYLHGHAALEHMSFQAGQDKSKPRRDDPNFEAENIFPLIIIFNLVMAKKKFKDCPAIVK